MKPFEAGINLRRKSIQGGVWGLLGSAGSALSGFLSFLLLSRILGPRAYGLMAMVETSLALGQKLMSSGLSEPLIQLPEPRPEHSDTLFWTLQGLGAALVGLMAWLSAPIGQYFREDSLPALLVAASFTLYLDATGLVPGARLAREFRFSEVAQADVLSEVAGGAAGVAWALAGQGVWSLIVQRLTASAVNAAVLWHRAGWRPRARWSGACLRDVWQFSASRGVEGLLQYADQQGPRLLLGHTLGAMELGYFVFARRVMENTIKVVTSAIRSTALTAFAHTQTDLERVKRIYQEGVSLTATAVFPVSMGIAVTAPLVVPLIAGPGWQEAVLPVQLLVLVAFRQAFHLWNAALLRGLGKPQYLLAASAVRTAVVLGLIAFLPQWGAAGACAAMLAGSFLSWPMAMAFVRRVTGLSMPGQLQPGAVPLAATLTMAAAALAVRAAVPPHPAGLAAIVAAGTAAYAAAMALVGRKELASIRRNLGELRRIRQG